MKTGIGGEKNCVHNHRKSLVARVLGILFASVVCVISLSDKAYAAETHEISWNFSEPTNGGDTIIIDTPILVNAEIGDSVRLAINGMVTNSLYEYAYLLINNAVVNTLEPIPYIETRVFDYQGTPTSEYELELCFRAHASVAAYSRKMTLTINWTESTGATPTETSDSTSEDEGKPSDLEPPKEIVPEMRLFAEGNVAKITTAPKGGTIDIDARPWNTFGHLEREALKARPDVTLKISFLSEGHKGMPLKLTIPAGTSIDSLYDDNGYMGLCRVGALLGYDE